MYPSRPFQEDRPDVLNAFIDAHPLGVLIVQNPQGPEAYHLPFIRAASGALQAHVSRSNPVWRSACGHENVLAIFHGPDGYISPNWYPGKQQHHRQVPTWNYQAVPARGQLSVKEDEAWLRELLTRLTQKHEATQQQPWQISDAPQEYIGAMLKAIVGIEIEVSELTGIMKLGQNKSAADLNGAAEGLIASGELAIGEAMLAAKRSE